MTLDEAIKELHRVTPADEPWTGEDVAYDQDREPDNIDHAIAAILNAVIAGELRKATEVRALVDAAIGLKGLVDGIQCAMEHGTFRAERSNLRMKDTDEWVAFYNALTAWENRNG